MGFLSNQVTSVVPRSTRKSIHMISSKLKLDINLVSGETWIGFPPSVMLEGPRVYTPPNRGEKNWGSIFLILFHQLEIPPSLRPYPGQIQETDVCVKKILPGVSVAVYPIFTLPCRLRLCPAESKQPVGMFELQPARGFKGRWDGPTSGMLETRAHCGEKWDKRASFPAMTKTSVPQFGIHNPLSPAIS